MTPADQRIVMWSVGIHRDSPEIDRIEDHEFVAAQTEQEALSIYFQSSYTTPKILRKLTQRSMVGKTAYSAKRCEQADKWAKEAGLAHLTSEQYRETKWAIEDEFQA